MINQPTYNASLVNQGVSVASVTQITTSGASMTNQGVSSGAVNNLPLPNARIEGLWVDSVFPWSLDAIWSYVSIEKSNVILTNI